MKKVTINLRPLNKTVMIDGPIEGQTFTLLQILKLLSTLYPEFQYALTTHPEFDYKIEKLAGFSNDRDFSWLFFVNNKLATYSIAQTVIRPGDIIDFDYCLRIAC